MTKPYDDESEWMALKILVGASGDIVKIEKEEMNRLIATVESLKENRRLWVSEADRYMKERDKAREENERLKAELKRSHTQNKLYQLDEAFKYYHEMTKEEAQKHCQAFLSEFD